MDIDERVAPHIPFVCCFVTNFAEQNKEKSKGRCQVHVLASKSLDPKMIFIDLHEASASTI